MVDAINFAVGQGLSAHLLVGQGADVQGELRVFKVADELGVVDRCDSVVDSLHLQLQNGVPDILRVSLLACRTASLTMVSQHVRQARAPRCCDRTWKRRKWG